MAIHYEFYESPSLDGKEKKNYHPRVVTFGKITTEQLAREIQYESSLTRADVKAVLTSLADKLAEHLAEGQKIHLEGIGYLSVSLQCDKEIHNHEDMKRAPVAFKSVNFRADEELKNRGSVCSRLCAFVENGEGSCARSDLGQSVTEEGEVEEGSDSRAACDGCEGEKHKYTSRDSGVYDVLAKSAEEALYYYDSENRAESSLPKLDIGREVEREKKAGYGSGEIAYGLLFLNAEIEEDLCENCTCNAGDDEEKRLDAEENDSRDGGGDHCDHDVKHNIVGGYAAVDMRCGSK
jgi:predicted histone-like DNA-binding protein